MNYSLILDTNPYFVHVVSNNILNYFTIIHEIFIYEYTSYMLAAN
jgi:hypothetical protein